MLLPRPSATLAPRAVRVRVAATSANLGPGYDSFGLALDLHDEVVAERIDAGLEITVDGVCSDTVPRDGSHLVVRAAARAFAAMGEDVPGLRMHCRNTIPHSSGQGSSAAAIVAGILMARALTPDGDRRLSDDGVFALATAMEGHPDNVAPALWGGFTIAWVADGPGDAVAPPARTVRLAPHPDVQAIVFTADSVCATDTARAALPATVPHHDAAANAARAALLCHALTAEPGLLWEATRDWLHQPYRASVMPETAALLERLRAGGLAAVLSGAGPSVLLLGAALPEPEDLRHTGFTARRVALSSGGAQVEIGAARQAPESGAIE